MKDYVVYYSTDTARIGQQKIFIDSLLKASSGGKRFYQYKAVGNPKRRKYYRWIDGGFRLPKLSADIDSWYSAAVFCEMYNPYAGRNILRKEKRSAVSIDCNFVILKWAKSELDFIPAPEQGKELVLSICHANGLPEPTITYTADGLELKWYWNDRMEKGTSDTKCFNADWDIMQEELRCKFSRLGASKSRITAMFRVPGSVNTVKSLKTKDRAVRDIHSGEKVSSFLEMQKILGLTPNKSESVNHDTLSSAEWESFRHSNARLVQDWLYDILKIHPSGINWVCTGIINNGKWTSHYEQACSLPAYLMKFSGSREFREYDIYVSQGEFLTRGNRKVSNLASIRVCFVDLDYKLMRGYRPEWTRNPSAEEWKELAERYCRKNNIPCPNDIVFTGGGVHLKWILDEAVSRTGLPNWQYAQKLLLCQFRTLGADPAAVDAARVLRLAGTKNHKDSPIIQERNVFVIGGEYFSGIKITLNELIKGLENSVPENAEEFNALISGRKESSARPESGMIHFMNDKGGKAKSARGKTKKRHIYNRKEDNLMKKKKTANAVPSDNKKRRGNFSVIARMRFTDIIHWLELQRDSSGEVPQNVRELSIFWALVSARQAGMIKSYVEFCDMAQKLINFCGKNFASECTIDTVISAYRKNYYIRTENLIRILEITPEAQKEMKVLKAGVQAVKKVRQPREQWLAEHDQTRKKVWILYGLSESTYYRRKKAGTLPPLPAETKENSSVVNILHNEHRKSRKKITSKTLN